MRKRKIKKWANFQIIKISLNPEQAVLSCCDTSIKAGITTPFDFQCNPGFCAGSGSAGSAISS
ncbi:MAG: hypothetical protein PHP69_01575 [Candidatus Omnitrophica bacterium]|jgi:hypothetical protein|nr:hypothetical protein [Candidatus Omnitrophota bacterium]MDD5081041.1 hypothetical protein [Candidatus Omnitrophota bacterium]MDD5441013.1 hypothetical protein [Candidatus Omnitrophota bacterium]